MSTNTQTGVSQTKQSRPLFSAQTSTITLRAPSHPAIFWSLAIFYLLVQVLFAPSAVLVGIAFATFPLFSAKYKSYPGLAAAWLWAYGIAVSCLVLYRSKSFMPEHLTIAQWWEASPGMVIGSFIAFFVALLVIAWHSTWVKMPNSEQIKPE